ncbi:AAA family ATPase [Isoptericola rhizosphaerae]|uniref:AAA family ATPase n=1 Tax=Isoptericola rhizosphaerae TaxID=3377837 RepID=UPI003839DCA6
MTHPDENQPAPAAPGASEARTDDSSQAPAASTTESAPTTGVAHAAAPASAAPAGEPAPPEPSQPSLELRRALAAVRTEVGKAVVGQDSAVTSLLIALLCSGHVLLEGVPGVAKTLLVRSLAASLDLDFKRVQFTPDLMPGDVTGSLVYDARTAEFSFRQGPVFTNLLLADEINRTPPKTQASLLESMEERQVSVDGQPRPLPEPFVVIATQNPVEHEGTYPLPEAQLDRFLLKVLLPLPERDSEIEVLARHAGGFDPRDLGAAGVRPVADPGVLAAARAEVRQVEVAPEVLGYAVDVCRATRQSPSLQLGVSPRGATALLATARAWAWLSGRMYVTPDDVKALAHPTLRHRVQLRPEAELEGVTAESVLGTVLAAVPVPR